MTALPAPAGDAITRLAAAIVAERKPMWKPASQAVSNLTRIERAARQGRSRAGELGHTLSVWIDDTPESLVADCLVCEELAAVDCSPNQPTEYLGRVFAGKCPGPYSRKVIR